MPGYKVATKDPLKEGLLCSECKYILKEAVQTSEGVRLCKSCYEEIAAEPNYKSPRTGIDVKDEDGKPSCYPDKAVRREVENIEVLCSYNTYGCPWVGKLAHLEEHTRKCRYQPVSCPNKHKGCNELLPPNEVNTHTANECEFRDVSCQYCDEIVTLKQLEEHHRNCVKYPVKCSLCSESVVRENLDQHHRNECSKVVCTCGKVLNRDGDVNDPDSLANHLQSPAEILSHLFNVESAMMGKVRSLELRLAAVEAGGTLSRYQSSELAKVRAEMQSNFKILSDRVDPLEHNHMKPVDKNLFSKLQEVQSIVQRLDKDTKKQEAQIRALQSQFQRKELEVSWEQTSEYGGSVNASRMTMLEKKYEDVERQMTMIKVHVSDLELQLQASLASTHTGTFLWRIPEVSRRRQDAIEERITSIYSPPFYTGRNGYKMCIRAYLNGDGMGRGTHISLFFVLMKGEFDALLKWPFDCKISLILVDQSHRKHIVQTFKPTPDSSSFRRPVTDMNVASGCPQFTKLSVLDDDSYVKNDTLFFKCIVDTSRIFHP